MTIQTKNNIEKWVSRLSGAIIMVLLSFISWIGYQGLDIMKQTQKDYLELKVKQVEIHDNFNSVYKYEIKENTRRSILNSAMIRNLQEKGTDEINRPAIQSTIR